VAKERLEQLEPQVKRLEAFLGNRANIS